VVLSDSFDDNEAASADQPIGGDATASSSRDLEEEERLARLEAERHSKFNAKCAIRRPESKIPHGKRSAGESCAPSPLASALRGKRGWVKCDAS
jgi:hypothetical protein